MISIFLPDSKGNGIKPGTVQFAQDLSGDWVDDADVEVLDDQDYVGSADADVVESAIVAQYDGASRVARSSLGNTGDLGHFAVLPASSQ
jgi:hypothetical protein